jgi:hypothetical protein
LNSGITIGYLDAEMTEMMRTYKHPARTFGPGDRECWVCGDRVTGAGGTLRHWGEAFRPTAPASEDLPAFRDALAVVQSALEEMLTEHVTDADRARAATEALYLAGALRTGRSRWKRPTLRAA